MAESASDADLFLETAGTLLAIMFLSAPVPQVYPLHSMPEKINSVNPASILALHANCAAQVIYGLYMPVPAAVPANLFGLVASIYYLSTCWYSAFCLDTLKSGAWNRSAALATIVTLSISLAMLLYTAFQLHPNAAEHVGNVALVFNVCLFAAPLSSLRTVFRNKSSELLPVLPSLLGLLCSGCWCYIGRRHESKPLWVPNSLGFILSSIQVMLICIFPSKKVKTMAEDLPHSVDVKEKT